MKRSEALRALSHQHHQGLFAALQLKRARQDSAAEARSVFLDFFQREGARHFRAEEELLLPAFARHTKPDQPALLEELDDAPERLVAVALQPALELVAGCTPGVELRSVVSGRMIGLAHAAVTWHGTRGRLAVGHVHDDLFLEIEQLEDGQGVALARGRSTRSKWPSFHPALTGVTQGSCRLCRPTGVVAL